MVKTKHISKSKNNRRQVGGDGPPDDNDNDVDTDNGGVRIVTRDQQLQRSNAERQRINTGRA